MCLKSDISKFQDLEKTYMSLVYPGQTFEEHVVPDVI